MKSEFQILDYPDCKIYIADKIKDVDWLEKKVLLSDYDFSIYTKINNNNRKREWLSVRYWIKELVGQCQIKYSESGKPYIDDSLKNISISHSGEKIAFIISNTNFVSIDIEKYNGRALKVRDKFVREDEVLMNSQTWDQTKYYTLIWSAKEVLFKYLDKRNVDFKDNFKTHVIDDLKVTGNFKANIILKDIIKLNMNYQFIEEYVLTWLSTDIYTKTSEYN